MMAMWFSVWRVTLASRQNQNTPAMALGITDHVWSIDELLDAALAIAPPTPIGTAPDRRRRFRVIEDGRS